jgi:protein O-mannosyl-transferase
MAKKTTTIPNPTATAVPTSASIPQFFGDNEDGFMNDLNYTNTFWSKISQGWVPYLIICVLGLIVYSNTFNHEYALDDDIIICKNEYVLQGMEGIPRIMKSDVFESFYNQMNTKAQLSGGRYRPFSVATFALEQEFLGTMVLPDSIKNMANEDSKRLATNAFLINYLNTSWDLNKNGKTDINEDINKDGLYNDKDSKIRGMAFRHVNSVLLYIISIALIYLFLSTYFFKNNKLVALLVSLLFLVHPLHTEVVANVKSRDEILSLLFIMLTMHLTFKYVETKKLWQIITASICYVIALLSKEYGAIMMIMLPIALWVSYKKVPILDLIKPMLFIGVAFAFYYYCRTQVVLPLDENEMQNVELLNNPYLLADEAQTKATHTFISAKYLWMMLFPTPLSCDYSYNVIEYKNFSDISTIISFIVLLAVIGAFFYTLIKRHWLAFPLGFLLLNLYLVNNFFFNIGATMGERLVYHSSLGFAMILVWAVAEALKKMVPDSAKHAGLLVGILLPIMLLYAVRTITRNPAWKNDIVLHLNDVKIYPNSTMLNGNAVTRLIELSEQPVNAKIANNLLDSAKIYGYKSLKLHDRFVNSYLNMGIIMAKRAKMDSAAYFWGKVREFYPNHPQLAAIDANLTSNFTTAAATKMQNKDFAGALELYLKAYQVTPQNPNLLNDMGACYYYLQNYAKAKECWTKGIALAPNDANLNRGMQALKAMGM